MSISSKSFAHTTPAFPTRVSTPNDMCLSCWVWGFPNISSFTIHVPKVEEPASVTCRSLQSRQHPEPPKEIEFYWQLRNPGGSFQNTRVGCAQEPVPLRSANSISQRYLPKRVQCHPAAFPSQGYRVPGCQCIQSLRIMIMGSRR